MHFNALKPTITRSTHFVIVLLLVIILALPAAPALAAEHALPAPCSWTIIVTSNADSGAGTLRQALVDVCDFGLITFSGDMTIPLTSAELAIDKSVTIDGEDNAVTISGGNAWRVFNIASGTVVNMHHLVIRDGDPGTENGGAIYNGAILTITDSVITANQAASGGGIYNKNTGILSVTDTTFSGNSADYNGGALNNTAPATIHNSTFTGNHADLGAAIYNYSSGASCSGTPALILTNSTISGNTADTTGMAIRNGFGLVEIHHSTISGNTSTATGLTVGALASVNNSFSCTRIRNSIVAGNSPYDLVATSTDQRYYTLDYNVIGTAGNNVDFTLELNAAHDQVNVTNPLLAALADNGGKTQTRALLAGSPALDVGPATPSIPFDQRGAPRPQNGLCDAGAFEWRSDNTAPLVVFGTGSVPAAEGGNIYPGPSQLRIQFSENVLGDGSDHAANSAWNYLLLAPGVNGVFDNGITSPGICDSDHVILPDDEKIEIDTITYDAPSMTATLAVNGGVPLADGTYRLYVCGAASIWDLMGNPLNNGANVAVNFSVGPGDNTAPQVVFGTGSVPPSNDASLSQGPSQLRIQFSEDVLGDGSAHAANAAANYLLLAPGVNGVFDNGITSPGICDPDHVILPDDVKIEIDSITYDAPSMTATLAVNGGAPLADGTYRLYVCGAASIWDLAGNALNNGANVAVNFSVAPSDNTAPQVVFGTGSVPPSDGASLSPGPSQLRIQFSEDVLGDGSDHAANAAANYLLLAPGVNGVFDNGITSPGICDPDHVILPDDVKIDIDSITYDAPSMTATLAVNGGVPLAEGAYRLYVCGAASIWDLAGNALNNGANVAVNFSVAPAAAPAPAAAMPATGFAPGAVTVLPPQGVDYAASDLVLEIPRLGLKTNILGVPQVNGAWDVTWLGRNTGWLQGTAFPTWAGNSVLTAHVWNADNSAGPFVYLNTLWYGDQIIVHAWGQDYIYEVRTVKLVRPDDTTLLTRHEDLPWLTLVTCRGYDADSGAYRYRVVVRAVQVGIR